MELPLFSIKASQSADISAIQRSLGHLSISGISIHGLFRTIGCIEIGESETMSYLVYRYILEVHERWIDSSISPIEMIIEEYIEFYDSPARWRS